MSETGYIKIKGTSATECYVETDINGSPASGTQKGLLLKVWKSDPNPGYGGGDTFWPDDDVLGLGEKELDETFPNETSVEYTCTIRFTSTWTQIPIGTVFRTDPAPVSSDHTPTNYWIFSIQAKVTTDPWPSTSDHPYIKFVITDEDGNVICSNTKSIGTTYAQYTWYSSAVPNTVTAGKDLILTISIGYFTETPT